MPVMHEYMLIEAHCQGNRGINAVNSLKPNMNTNGFLPTGKDKKFAHEYLTQTANNSY